MAKLIKLLSKILPTQFAYAHCDIPCGIYDSKPAQIAAATVLKMVQLIEALPKEQTMEDHNNFVRMVMVKEEHAQKCKTEILILWTDYFKEEDLQTFPDLHDVFYKTAKLCSKNKQTVSVENAEALINAVDKIAEIFNKTKEARAAQKK